MLLVMNILQKCLLLNKRMVVLMKSQVINFRLNPKKTEDKRILDFLNKQMEATEQDKGVSGRKMTQTDVIKSVFLDVIDGAEKQKQELLHRQETAELAAKMTDLVKKQMAELMQEHDTKMITMLLSVVSQLPKNMQEFVPVMADHVMQKQERTQEQKKAETEDDWQNLDTFPVAGDEPMEEAVKTGLAAMFGRFLY